MVKTQHAIMMEIWGVVKGQGLSFMLICGVTYFFWGQFIELNEKVDNCQSENVQILQETVNRNTEALNRITKYISE